MHHNIFQAPLKNPQRILDVGCGTGRVSVQLAAKFPNAQVIGLDLSPVPSIYRKPDNVEFVQGDFMQLADSGDARFREGSFDYIFDRLLILGMTDWSGYLIKVKKLLAPGGWVEGHEVDMTPRDSAQHDLTSGFPFGEAFMRLGKVNQMDLAAGHNLPFYMRKSGMQDIQGQTYVWPILPNPGKPETEVGVR
jgi:ubiquinone/menaquinone biosynthesis C-methylase UbiE